MDEETKARIDALETSIANLSGKIDQLFMRPRMPYTQSAVDGDFCRLDSNKKPYWDNS